MSEKIGDIKAQLSKATSVEEYEQFCDRFADDERAGVQKLIESA